ncbi:transglycosylase domain-containing protein [Kaistia nematophila]|uniref:PBP1A family penicillin-binding protein n=1 Tax=Kaistia nematophila TaxID=2994654 RepID=A0A9X3E5F0_9HYPH|nr:PBP1A family penicillin-binding protein [Kaistia nematophila]MCX5572199.1 PBP1A family penicillin-binding protein [Kaistia nematophila]
MRKLQDRISGWLGSLKPGRDPSAGPAGGEASANPGAPKAEQTGGETPGPAAPKTPWLRLIEIDAFIDSALYRIWTGLKDGAEALSRFARHFRMTGWRRAPFEILGDGLTMAAGGAVVMLTLALPAFDATKQDWLAQSDYSVTFLDRYGAEIGKRGVRHSESVPLEEMPDSLIKATLATEDRRFYTHFGIDIIGTARALMENLRNDAVRQGGSSITQQLAKNLFLSNERTLDRKIKEAFLALYLESNLSKHDILQLYLDRAYMGGGNFGAAAAAEFYFGKKVQDINLAEAAMLSGLYKAPARYAPHINLPAARARANDVLTNMVQAGFMTEGQVMGARRKPADVVRKAADTAPDYFLDWAFDEVKKQVPDGDRSLIVRSTVDMNLQKTADEAIEGALRDSGERYRVSQAAMVVAEPDGAVRAMVGGRDYGESQFNRATDALRQPGSSFKPFVYTTAIQHGYTPKSIVVDAPISIGNWSPKNYGGRYMGSIQLTTALIHSLNTVAVRLAGAVGRPAIIDLAHRMGITTNIINSKSLPLGATDVRVLDMTGAYAVFANGGMKATPYAFTQILNSQGEVVFDRKRDVPPPERVLDEKTVGMMNYMLGQVPERGTGRAAKLQGIKTAGKTGTTNAYRDAWFMGFTGNYVGGIWFGNDDFTSSNKMTGGSLPAQTWNRVMTYAHNGIELKPIPGIDEPASDGPRPAPAVASNDADQRPLSLSARTTERLIALEKLFDTAPPLKPQNAVSFESGEKIRAAALEGDDTAAR